MLRIFGVKQHCSRRKPSFLSQNITIGSRLYHVHASSLFLNDNTENSLLACGIAYRKFTLAWVYHASGGTGDGSGIRTHF